MKVRVLRLLLCGFGLALLAPAGARAFWFDGLDDVCRAPGGREINNSEECATLIERQEIGHTNGAVVRNGTQLLVKAKANTVRLADSGGEEGESYHYLHYFPDLNQYLIYKQYSEGGAFYVIDARSGAEVQIPDVPTPSPDGRRFVASSHNLLEEPVTEIWRIDADQPRKEWGYAPKGWAGGRAQWVSPAEVRIPTDGWVESEHVPVPDGVPKFVSVKLVNGEWVGENLPPPSQESGQTEGE